MLVIDTNVLVSHLFWPDSPIRQMVKELIATSKVLRSIDSFAELSEVVMRRKFDRYMPVAERELFLSSFYDSSRHVVINRRVDSCRDPKDNKFLELAVCGGAGMLLTGDKDLLSLDPFEGVRIIIPKILFLSRSPRFQPGEHCL